MTLEQAEEAMNSIHMPGATSQSGIPESDGQNILALPAPPVPQNQNPAMGSMNPQGAMNQGAAIPPPASLSGPPMQMGQPGMNPNMSMGMGMPPQNYPGPPENNNMMPGNNNMHGNMQGNMPNNLPPVPMGPVPTSYSGPPIGTPSPFLQVEGMVTSDVLRDDNEYAEVKLSSVSDAWIWAVCLVIAHEGIRRQYIATMIQKQQCALDASNLRKQRSSMIITFASTWQLV